MVENIFTIRELDEDEEKHLKYQAIVFGDVLAVWNLFWVLNPQYVDEKDKTKNDCDYSEIVQRAFSLFVNRLDRYFIITPGLRLDSTLTHLSTYVQTPFELLVTRLNYDRI